MDDINFDDSDFNPSFFEGGRGGDEESGQESSQSGDFDGGIDGGLGGGQKDSHADGEYEDFEYSHDDDEFQTPENAFEMSQRFVEIAKVFGRSTAAHETAPWIRGLDLLERSGLILPHPDQMPEDEDELTGLVWQVIEALSRHNIFLYHTDHLNEKELYQKLYDVVLQEPVKDYAQVVDPDEITRPGFWTCCYDLTEIGDLDAGWLVYLQYYADENERDIEKRVCPQTVLPPRQEPRYDRDRFLPRSAEQRFAEMGVVPPEEAWFDEKLKQGFD